MNTATDVLQASTITENSVTLPQQLPRPLYESVDKVLKKAGGKWNRKAGAHVFSRDPRQALAEYLTSGKIVDVKQQLQAFYTPEAVIDEMVMLADLNEGHHVLEPSAGDGRIARRMKSLGCLVDVCEIDDQSRDKLHEEFLVVGSDFLKLDPAAAYDRILMNPPFTNGQDIAHVLHAWEHLKPDGVLVAITSPSWKFREDKKYAAFREFMDENQTYDEELPEGTFKESGTNIRTILVVLRK